MIKVITVYLMLGIQVIALSDTPKVGCSEVLTLCQTLVKAQDQSITMLKKENLELENKIAVAEDHTSSLPWYVYAITGLALGFVVGTTLK
jgi:hypothetical protein